MIRNDPKIESTYGSGNVIGRGGDGDRARKTCDYDTHLTRRRSLTQQNAAEDSNSGELVLIYANSPPPSDVTARLQLALGAGHSYLMMRWR